MTTSRRLVGLYLLVTSWFLPSIISAQPAAPEPPSPREVREEQRIILNAYIMQGEQYLGKSREQLADNHLAASQENGFHAIELLARAKAKLNHHSEKIEQLHGLFIGEGTREELRKNLRDNINPRYFSLQEHLDSIADQFAKKGDNTLKNALVPATGGDVKGVLEIGRTIGYKSIGDPEGPGSSGPSSSYGPSSSGPSGRSAIPSIPGSTMSPDGTGKVRLDIPGMGPISIAGTPTADGGIDSPQYGQIDLASGTKLPDGSVAFQTSKGVLVIGPDGTQSFIPGAKLNPDGSAKLIDGTTVSLTNLHKDSSGNIVTGDNRRINSQGRSESGGSSGPSGPSGSARGGFDGKGPAPGGTQFVDQNGNPITVDPDWNNGEQSGVRRSYLGGKGARLVSEAKVVRKIVQSSGNQCVVSEIPGESRTWKLAIATGEPRTANGSSQITLTLADGGGLTDFTVKGWDATSSSGAHAAVTPSADKPGEAIATFSQDGDYEITATGQTSWGSEFKITGKSGIYR